MNTIISLQMHLSDQVDLAIQAYCYRTNKPHGYVDSAFRGFIHAQVGRFFRYCGKNMATERYWTKDDLVSLVGAIAEAYETGYLQCQRENKGE